MAGYAQEHILYTMERLMETKTLDKIKVADIVSEGSINRKTFYYHFHGMEDLLRWMVGMQLDQLDLNNATSENWKEKMGALTDCISKRQAFFTAVLTSKYAPEIESYMVSKLGRFIRIFIDNCIKEAEALHGHRIDIEQKYRDHIYSYYSRGVLSLVADWIKSGCKETSEDFLDIVDHLTSNTIFNVIDSFSPA